MDQVKGVLCIPCNAAFGACGLPNPCAADGPIVENVEKIVKKCGEVIGRFVLNYVGGVVIYKIKAGLIQAVEDAVKEAAGKGGDGLPPVPLVKDEPSIVLLDITNRSSQWDATDTKFTAYDIVGARIHPGLSRLRGTRKRYRLLLTHDTDFRLWANEKKVKIPEAAVFPPKQYFGRFDSEFLNGRQTALKQWVRAWAASDITKDDRFLRHFDLDEDPNREVDKFIFAGAFNATMDALDVTCWDDPKDFADEGEGLRVMCVLVARKTLFPEIESKLYGDGGRGGQLAVSFFRKAANVAVGNTVDAMWAPARIGFNKAKEFVNTKLDTIKEKITEVITKVVGGLVQKVREKQPDPAMPKEKEPEKEKDDKAEKKEAGWPGVQHSAYVQSLIADVKRNEKSAKAFEELRRGFANAWTAKLKMSRKVMWYIREVPDIYLQWMLWRLLSAVEGMFDLFQDHVEGILDGLHGFAKARDVLEEKLRAITGDGSKGVDAYALDAKKPIGEFADTMKQEMINLATSLGKELWRNKSNLRWSLRELSGEASDGLMELVSVLPEKTLNYLANLRLSLLAAVPGVYERAAKENGKVSADTVAVTLRTIFLEQLSTGFDAHFVHTWEILRREVLKSTQITMIDKLFEVVKPVVESVVSGLAGIMPDSIANMLKVEQLAEQATRKILEFAAKKLVEYFRVKLEAYMFAEAEPVDPRDAEDERKRVESKNKAKEEKQKEDDKYKKE